MSAEQSETHDLDSLVLDTGETPILLRPSVITAIVIGFLALVGIYFWVAAAFNISFTVDARPFRDWVDRWGIWGPLVFIAIMALSVLFAPIPNAPIFVAAGLAWGPILGTFYSMVGMLLGSAMAFWVARRLGRGYLPRLIGHKAARRLDQLTDAMGGRLVFWARMMPAVNFDWISYLAGLTSIRFWPFFFYSLLGMLTPTAVAVVAGDSLGKDFRITLGLGGLWVLGIVLSGAYFWWRRHHFQFHG